MAEKTLDDRRAEERATGAAPQPKDHFLQLMFFQRSETPEEARKFEAARNALRRSTEPYLPLQYARWRPGERYHLPLPSRPAPVRLDSPATEVMTDFRRVSAVTVRGDYPVADANRLMIDNRVRALFVVDEARRVSGIITSIDVLSDKPVQFAHGGGLHYEEVLVRDIMTPADRLEVIDFQDVLRARVGDIVATLRLAGRQHALALERQPGGEDHVVRGIFSLTQIARQLGIPPQPVHDIARTFAEIEAVVAH